jgi:hypothetical protein
MKKLVIFALFFSLVFVFGACQTSQESGSAVADNSSIDYSDYSEISYDSLLVSLKDNPSSLQRRKYRGTYIPVRIFYQIPEKIRKQANKGDKILMVTPKNGQYRLFLLFPNDKKEEIKSFIRKYQQISFIYEPVGMFNKRSPLLRYIAAKAIN